VGREQSAGLKERRKRKDPNHVHEEEKEVSVEKTKKDKKKKNSNLLRKRGWGCDLGLLWGGGGREVERDSERGSKGST